MSMFRTILKFSDISLNFQQDNLKPSFIFRLFIHNRHFYPPRRRADNTSSALLRRGLGWDGLQYKSTASSVDAAHLRHSRLVNCSEMEKY